MACLYCKSENPPGQKFCGECGKPTQDSILSAEIVAAIDARIGEAIKEQFDDQDMVEIKIAQAVVTRVTDWAKLFALITAVPLAILLATLAIWGVTSFLDFRKEVDSGKAQITEDIKDARNDIQNTRNATISLRAQVDAAHRELGSLPSDVKSLQSKVATLEEKIDIRPTPDLTPQLKAKLKSALDGFQSYCRSIGFTPKVGEVHLRIVQGPKDRLGTAMYYDASKSEMIVDASKSDDPSIALREYMHRTLYPKSLLPGPIVNAPPAPSPALGWIAIESGMAWYLPASFLNTSHVGRFDLSQTELPPPPRDMASAEEWGDRVWGSAFWEIRNTIGRETCDKLLVRFWDGLDPYDKSPYASYALSRLLSLYQDTGGSDSAKITAIFSRRGIR